MTRDQFDARYASTQENTEGYTDAELRRINDEVFAAVADLDVHDVEVPELVKGACDRAHNRFVR